MESSFFEYRNDTTGKVDSDSDGFIDNSFDEVSLNIQKQLTASAKKNKTVYVPESDDSDVTITDDLDTEEVSVAPRNVLNTLKKVAQHVVVDSSDEDGSRRGSIQKANDSASNVVLESSTDDDDAIDTTADASPEMIPRRRLTKKSVDSSDSPLIRRVKKRIMVFTDSEHENSIVIEKDNNTKQVCLKDTPLKIDNGTDQSVNLNISTDNLDASTTDLNMSNDKSPVLSRNSSRNTPTSILTEDDEDAMFEEQLVMSKATRMSIMGVVPSNTDSDESDFIQSDESTRKSSIYSNIDNDLPDPGVTTSPPPVDLVTTDDLDDSRISCSTFGSPVTERTIRESPSKQEPHTISLLDGDNFVEPPPKGFPKPKMSSGIVVRKGGSNTIVYDDDVTIIDHQPEIIALSSDEENSPRKKSTSPKPRSPKNENGSTSRRSSKDKDSKENTISRYLLPTSYPNQGVVYVKKHVREKELSKLNELKEDLQNVRYLLENMEMDTLPDGGVRLIERLSALEADVRRQGDKVANMLVEAEEPSSKGMYEEGVDKPLSWDEIQKNSNQVQPRMFGKQAMATHMAERSLILDRLRDLHESLASRPSEGTLAVAPRLLRAELMPHQRHALAWLQWRETQRPPVGILADDMGLGKTITMISLIASDKERHIDEDSDDEDDEWRGKENSRKVRGGTLVVCPASLLEQWGQEVSKHCTPHSLSVLLHHGPGRATQPSRIAAHDIVVTTYSLMQRDNGGPLSRIRWRRAVLDEAHAVRNHKSLTCAGVTALSARRRWALTGTPVQNKDLDVFALLKFLHCTPFDDLTMWKKWIDNKSMGGQERLATIMGCLLLRRTKAQLQAKGQLACLPDRTEKDITVKLDSDEMNVYQKVLVFSKTLFAQFLHQRAEKQADMADGFLPKATSKDDPYAKMHKKMVALQGAKPVKSHEILVLLLRLRQLCCHCGLIASTLEGDRDAAPHQADIDLLSELDKLTIDDSRRKSGIRKDEEEEEGGTEPVESTTVAEAIRSVLSPNNPVFRLDRRSSKIRAVMDCLHQEVFVHKGEKAVIVSQWTSVLRLVERELTAAKIKSVTLSGTVPVSKRPPLIQALNDPNSDVRVMLLSLCAGGVGLNLCGAARLLLLDPHWNPQLERQAQDRVYRVGQTRPVTVYRFMCQDTVEASIRRLQDMKLAIADTVLTGAKPGPQSKLSIDDLKLLFNMNA